MADNDWMKRGGIVAMLALAIAGCGGDPYANVRYSDSAINLKDDAVANVALDEGLDDSLAGLGFTDREGKPVDLAQYRGKKNVVLVITRGYGVGGYGGGVCLYCASQTSRLIEHYDEFAKRDAEVVVVFPVEKADEGASLDGKFDDVQRRLYQELKRKPEPTPFPLLWDVDLMAVDKLGIRKDLSKPATYILDKEGRVSFAYVGETLSDRPSLVVMLEELDRLQQTSGSAETNAPAATGTESE